MWYFGIVFFQLKDNKVLHLHRLMSESNLVIARKGQDE
jgi:hypothetical protein